MAEDLSRRVGTPFGPLPADLLGPRKGRPEEVVWATFAATPSFTDDFGAGGGTRTPDLARMNGYPSCALPAIARSCVTGGHSSSNRDPACFTVRQDDSSRKVTENRADCNAAPGLRLDHPLTGSRWQSTCGRCLRNSVPVPAVDADHAWAELSASAGRTSFPDTAARDTPCTRSAARRPRTRRSRGACESDDEPSDVSLLAATSLGAKRRASETPDPLQAWRSGLAHPA